MKGRLTATCDNLWGLYDVSQGFTYLRHICERERIIFQNSTDPTFVLLATFWHALYAWDEALQFLYTHFCWLVSLEFGTPGHQVAHVLRWLGIASDKYE